MSARAVDVRIARGLLGSHVRRRADARAQLCQRRPAGAGARRADGLGDAEIGHDGDAAGDEHVVRLDVAVDDAALVRVGERLRHVAQDADDFADGERAVGEARAQRFAVDERHRVEGESVRIARGQHRDDVRVLQRRDRLDLALEALDADPLRQFGRQHLDDDPPLEPQFLGDEHARHAAAAEFALERVAAAQRRLELVAQVRGRQSALLRIESEYVSRWLPVRLPLHGRSRGAALLLVAQRRRGLERRGVARGNP